MFPGKGRCFKVWKMTGLGNSEDSAFGGEQGVKELDPSDVFFCLAFIDANVCMVYHKH